MRTLMLLTRDNLNALPRLLPLMADAKVEHIAGLIEAVLPSVVRQRRPNTVAESNIRRTRPTPWAYG